MPLDTRQKSAAAFNAIQKSAKAMFWCRSPRAKINAARTTTFFVHCFGRIASNALSSHGLLIGVTSVASTLRGFRMFGAVRFSLLRNSNFQTIHSASRTIFELIFDCPDRRSSNVIGTSTTWNPRIHASLVISIWNEYPLDLIRSRSMDSSTARR